MTVGRTRSPHVRPGPPPHGADRELDIATVFLGPDAAARMGAIIRKGTDEGIRS